MKDKELFNEWMKIAVPYLRTLADLPDEQARLSDAFADYLLEDFGMN